MSLMNIAAPVIPQKPDDKKEEVDDGEGFGDFNDTPNQPAEEKKDTGGDPFTDLIGV